MTKQPIDARAAGTSRACGSSSVGVRVDHADRRPPAGPLGKELRGSVGAEPGQSELLALLEAEAGLAAQRVAERGAPDRDGVEDGRLDDRRRGRRR